MADFEAKSPIETEKAGAFLHDRSNRPKRPVTDQQEQAQQYLPLAIALICGVGMVALAFQARASWESHRDWVVPVTLPLLVIGGLAFGHLLARREWNPLTPAMFLVAGIIALTGWDVWLDAEEKSSGLRDAIAIGNGVFLAFAVILSVGALVWVEWKRPAKAPLAEG